VAQPLLAFRDGRPTNVNTEQSGRQDEKVDTVRVLKLQNVEDELLPTSQIERLVTRKKRRRNEAGVDLEELTPEERASEEFRLDLASCAAPVEVKAYQETPVDGFGLRMLRGMGWSETDVVAAPVEAPLRQHRVGLGADPAALRKQGIQAARSRAKSNQSPERQEDDSQPLRQTQKDSSQAPK